MRRARRLVAAGVGMATVAAMSIGGSVGATTSVKDYAEGTNGYETRSLFSVDDTVPRTDDASQSYRMVGIPDGLGAHDTKTGAALYMNHEFTGSTTSQPLVGGPTYRGAIVSRFELDADGDPVSGDLAFRRVFQDETLVGRTATTDNSTPAFSRFCSAFLAGPDDGFDRYIYLAGEESGGIDTFDGRGGQSVAIVDGKAYALSGMGHFAKENQVVWPNDGKRTVVFPLEDGPTTPDSQLWMYVGHKKTSSTNPIVKNGLFGGSLYVFVGDDAAVNEESVFTSGSIGGHWEKIEGADTMDESQLEAAADAAGAFGFVRVEDGAVSDANRNDFYFVTTGGNAAEGNDLGRLYRLELARRSPLGDPTIEIVYNADTVVAGGGDIAISPDNIDISSDAIMIQEDGTSSSRPVFAAKGREAGIWRLDFATGSVDASTATLVAVLTPPGRDGVPIPVPGTWETSGIIDTAGMFGGDTWIFDVQAHAPTTAPAAQTVEDGQLLMLVPAAPGPV